ncbi:hypothetical protein Ocin01_02101 [Orchesella cincta]|uniref:Uncharacterized protein n=1 Tax=Orchesella cincta TaxID=48709 RepID=A0A1D2NH64_ORCCI|nr:hypothetical protein Ocin01_02101 [Orchesella cincta]
MSSTENLTVSLFEEEAETPVRVITGITRKELSQRIKELINKVDMLNDKMDNILESIRRRRERSRSPSPLPGFRAKENYLYGD